MNNKLLLSLVLSSSLALGLGGCAMQPQQPQMTPLQIQAMQTKSFKTSKRKAFNSTMQVFQDLGYTVNSANYDTGFITAKSLTKDGQGNAPNGAGARFLSAMIQMSMAGHGQRRDSNHYTKATAFVSNLGHGQTRVRVSFVNVTKTSINGGSPEERDQQILNPNIYNRIFNRIRQALFVGKALS